MSSSAAGYEGLHLVLPQKPDPERDAVAAAWRERGGRVQRLARFWEPPALPRERVRIYGNDTFALIVAQRLELELLSPADDLLLHAPPAALRRELHGLPLARARSLAYPRFVKSAVPKLFPAAVYASAEALERACAGLEPQTLLLAAEVVQFDAEVRCFMLGHELLSAACYEGCCATLDAPAALARELAALLPLPPAVVLDLGHIEGRGWALIEANAAWGAGLNGCAAVAAARCIAAVCQPLPAPTSSAR